MAAANANWYGTKLVAVLDFWLGVDGKLAHPIAVVFVLLFGVLVNVPVRVLK